MLVDYDEYFQLCRTASVPVGSMETQQVIDVLKEKYPHAFRMVKDEPHLEVAVALSGTTLPLMNDWARRMGEGATFDLFHKSLSEVLMQQEGAA
jgi:hypothetical protein